MRIAIVTDTLAGLGGTEASVISTAEQLARAGNAVVVFAYGVYGEANATWTERLAQAGVEIIERMATPYNNGVSNETFKAEIVSYLEWWRPDVVHAIPVESLGGRCPEINDTLPCIPIVGTVTSDPSPRCFWYNDERQPYLARYSGIIAPSKRIAAGVRNFLCPTAVVYEVPILITSPRKSFPLTSGELEGRCHLGAITRLRIEKGYEFLLASIAILAKTHPQVTLSIYGETPELERALQIAQSFGIDDRILVKGPFRGPFEIDQVVSSHCIFLLSSLFEGTPLALIETAMRGRLTVATDVGGVADLLGISGAGTIVPAGDPAAMAAATARLLDDPDGIRNLSAAAIDSTVAYFSPDRVIPRLLAAYRDARFRVCQIT